MENINMIKLSLQPADFDMFKKFLIAWHFTNNINIHGSVIQQQIAKSAWVYCDLTSILPQKVDMAVLVDKFNVKELKKIMLRDNIPGILFKPDNNPCGQPRLGLGYSIFGQMVMLARAGLFKINQN